MADRKPDWTIGRLRDFRTEWGVAHTRLTHPEFSRMMIPSTDIDLKVEGKPRKRFDLVCW